MTFPSSPTFPVRFNRPVSSTFPAAPTFPPVFDPTAAAFFAAQTAAGQTLTSAQMSAINTLCVSGKANGWFSAMLALYPFLGNSATCDSFNLINPATFQITWNGTVVHNSGGVTPDGTTGYGDTGLVPSTSLDPSNTSQGLYATVVNDGGGFDNGSVSDALPSFFWVTANHSGEPDIATGNTSSRIVSGTSSPGFVSCTNTAATTTELYFNGLPQASGAAGTPILPPYSIFIGGFNRNGSLANANSNTYALYAVGGTLTAPQVVLMYSDIQAFQTSLSRQV